MIILDADDCGWVAVLDALDTRTTAKDTCQVRRFVAYIQRKRAPIGDMLLCEELGDTLSEPLGRLAGDKEGIVQLVAGVDEIVVYYTGRGVADAPDAPFALRRERIAVPGIYPLDLAAARRLRNIAGHLLLTDAWYAPYAK